MTSRAIGVLLSLAMVLDFAPEASANVSSYYYQNDPDYAAAFRSQVTGVVVFIFAWAGVLLLLVWVRRRLPALGRAFIDIFGVMGTLTMLLTLPQLFGEGTGRVNFMVDDRPEGAVGKQGFGKANSTGERIFPGPLLIGEILSVVCLVIGWLAIRYSREHRLSAHELRMPNR